MDFAFHKCKFVVRFEVTKLSDYALATLVGTVDAISREKHGGSRARLLCAVDCNLLISDTYIRCTSST
jgi:hypothetical protein